MFEENNKEKSLSRRDLIINAGKLAVGAVGIAAVSAGGLDLLSKAEAKGAAKYPWGYKKVDPDKAAQIAYEKWYEGYCCYAVTSGIFIPLQKKIGAPYTNLPLDAFRFGHGGVIGWGTICGTLLGAGIATSFIAGKEGEEILNEAINWYATTELPIFNPKNPKANFKNVTTSDSPLCHVSVNKWMKKENVGYKSPERRDRCARLAADMASKTVTLLNQWADGKFEAVNDSQFSMYKTSTQNNCTACHGANIPDVPQ